MVVVNTHNPANFPELPNIKLTINVIIHTSVISIDFMYDSRSGTTRLNMTPNNINIDSIDMVLISITLTRWVKLGLYFVTRYNKNTADVGINVVSFNVCNGNSGTRATVMNNPNNINISTTAVGFNS